MQENELNYYEEIGNWDFSKIKYTTEKLTNWDFYNKIKENTNKKSLCLDLGTGGGEKVLENYPDVAMIIAIDFSKKMIKRAKENKKEYPSRNIKFINMDNLNMKFPNDLFDLVTARHTIINAEQIYNCLDENGTLIIEGVDRQDCWELKEMFGRGQSYNDKISISEKDYEDLKEAGFREIEKVEILENEYYETKEDLLALLLKTPILDNFSEIDDNITFEHRYTLEQDILNRYINKYKNKRGILLKRRLYGIVAKK